MQIIGIAAALLRALVGVLTRLAGPVVVRVSTRVITAIGPRVLAAMSKASAATLRVARGEVNKYGLVTWDVSEDFATFVARNKGDKLAVVLALVTAGIVVGVVEVGELWDMFFGDEKGSNLANPGPGDLNQETLDSLIAAARDAKQAAGDVVDATRKSAAAIKQDLVAARQSVAVDDGGMLTVMVRGGREGLAKLRDLTMDALSSYPKGRTDERELMHHWPGEVQEVACACHDLRGQCEDFRNSVNCLLARYFGSADNALAIVTAIRSVNLTSLREYRDRNRGH